MAKIQRCTKSIAQVLKERKTKLEAENISKAKKKSELRFKNYLSKTAKSIMEDFPKYELQTNKLDTFSSSYIPVQSESIWAPWSKMFKKGKAK